MVPSYHLCRSSKILANQANPTTHLIIHSLEITKEKKCKLPNQAIFLHLLTLCIVSTTLHYHATYVQQY
jgi:hypothetical protein